MSHHTLDNAVPYTIILASSSPRRRQLLKVLGLEFTVILPESEEFSDTKTDRDSGIDETPLPGESPPDLVQRLSRAKAQAVANRLLSPAVAQSLPRSNRTRTRAVIIAADTVVVLKDEILGKPTSPADARQMLRQLRHHKFHYVYSGLTVGIKDVEFETAQSSQDRLYDSPAHLLTRLHQSQVWMRPYSDAELEAYVASGDPLDKAGAYGIQNQNFAPVEQLDGCFASVMGLPLGELAAALVDIGLSVPQVASRCARYTGSSCCQQPLVSSASSPI